MKILVISGFLGAGKTTFIRMLSEKTGGNFVVMENEYGETGIDGALLQQDRLNVWELTEGCICCSLKSDFASSILTVVNTLDPEYLVVEPTGVGLLSAVMHNIGKIAYERIQLLDPLTIADVHCVEDYMREFKDIYIDQIKNAPRILLSKIERAPAEKVARITAILHEVNPQAEILNTPYQNQPAEWWLQLLKHPYDMERTVILSQTERFPDLENVSFTHIMIASVNELLEILVALLRGYFGIVYRAKGFVPIGGQWTKFDIVDKQYTVAICGRMRESKAVIIGQDLNRERLRNALTGS